jgi:peptide/nickel transport system permease protein
MRLSDVLSDLASFWSEFRRNPLGLVGLFLLLGFMALAIFGPALVPFKNADKEWHNISFWQDNSEKAPPVWTNLLAAKKVAETEQIGDFKAEDIDLDGSRLRVLSLEYEFRADVAPADLVPHFTGSGQVPVKLEVNRPDGVTIELWKDVLDLVPEDDNRISVDRSCKPAIMDFLRGIDEAMAANLQQDMIRSTTVLFSEAAPDMVGRPVPLKGKYVFTITGLMLAEDSSLDSASMVVSGGVSGWLGTDVYKRDIFTGVVIGIRWAFIIGFLTSIIIVVVGVFLAVFAAYFGGAADWLINRVYELVYLMPVIPFLIVLSAIFTPSIWTMIGIICLFFWTGPFKPVYSMALQIKEETYVEASRALGAGRLRIITRHIIPILLPFSFAVMALSIPAVIVYEASISLLGLGDATIVTWGQILNNAFHNGAVISNIWWWVVPPGLMIALMGMTFAFLGTALDKILHPKLKTR